MIWTALCFAFVFENLGNVIIPKPQFQLYFLYPQTRRKWDQSQLANFDVLVQAFEYRFDFPLIVLWLYFVTFCHGPTKSCFCYLFFQECSDLFQEFGFLRIRKFKKINHFSFHLSYPWLKILFLNKFVVSAIYMMRNWI